VDRNRIGDLEHPDDPDRAQVLSASVEHRRAWLEGYRGTLGFLTMLLGRPQGG